MVPPQVDKGFNLLETASKVIPQGKIVQTAKESWKFAWKRMMTELAPQDKTGSYQRPTYTFGGDGLGSTQYPAEANRYHLYVGNPCPWCHRVRLVSELLELSRENRLGITVLIDDPVKASRGGWVFDQPPSQAPQLADLRALYDYLSPGFQGRCTAPLLVDWKTRTIVCNESKDLVRMLPLLQQQQQNDESGNMELYPEALKSQIDETNEWIYRLLNNGVYRCGFSTSQSAYQLASKDVTSGLERIETILSKQDYLVGDKLTESDVMLLPTLLRFDGVYSPLFGAGGKHIRLECDFPQTFQWMKRCWSIDAVRRSINLPDACSSYYRQLFPLNPGGIQPTPVTARTLRLDV